MENKHSWGEPRTGFADLAPLNFEELTARCMGHLDLAERLLGSFSERFINEVSELEASLDARDAAQFARLAHRLKGSAANVSAPSLCSILERIEGAGLAEQWDDVSAWLIRLHEEWDRFTQYKASRTAGTTVK